VLSSGKDDIMALTNNGKGMAGMDKPCTPDNERGAAGKDSPHMLGNEATFRQLMDFIQGLTTQEELAQNREKRRPSCEQLRKQYAVRIMFEKFLTDIAAGNFSGQNQ
jgi:hypothetical protein